MALTPKTPCRILKGIEITVHLGVASLPRLRRILKGIERRTRRDSDRWTLWLRRILKGIESPPSSNFLLSNSSSRILKGIESRELPGVYRTVAAR